ncbi:MAG: FAD binding domain-containing protein, partial [Actinocrinis sp.]
MGAQPGPEPVPDLPDLQGDLRGPGVLPRGRGRLGRCQVAASAPGATAAGPAVFLPGTTTEALDALAARPDATVVAGGTEVMARVNAGGLRPAALVVIDRIDDLRGVWFAEQEIVLG